MCMYFNALCFHCVCIAAYPAGNEQSTPGRLQLARRQANPRSQQAIFSWSSQKIEKGVGNWSGTSFDH